MENGNRSRALSSGRLTTARTTASAAGRHAAHDDDFVSMTTAIRPRRSTVLYCTGTMANHFFKIIHQLIKPSLNVMNYLLVGLITSLFLVSQSTPYALLSKAQEFHLLLGQRKSTVFSK
jgi:hypothetical protein